MDAAKLRALADETEREILALVSEEENITGDVVNRFDMGRPAQRNIPDCRVSRPPSADRSAAALQRREIISRDSIWHYSRGERLSKPGEGGMKLDFTQIGVPPTATRATAVAGQRPIGRQ
jgi:hypothetical protein